MSSLDGKLTKMMALGFGFNALTQASLALAAVDRLIFSLISIQMCTFVSLEFLRRRYANLYRRVCGTNLANSGHGIKGWSF